MRVNEEKKRLCVFLFGDYKFLTTSLIMRQLFWPVTGRFIRTLTEDFETPDLAWESWDNVEGGNPFVCDFQKLQEEDRIDMLDKLFQIHLKDIGMEGYCPGNIPSLSLLAMNALKVAKRPNTVANLINLIEFAHHWQRLLRQNHLMLSTSRWGKFCHLSKKQPTSMNQTEICAIVIKNTMMKYGSKLGGVKVVAPQN